MKDDEQPDVAAITAMTDVIKFTTSLATGALVFGVGLTTAGTTVYTAAIESVLILSWSLFAISIGCGLWTLYYTPALVHGHLTIYSNEFRVPGIASFFSFVLGAVAVATVLIASIRDGPVLTSNLINSPTKAVTAAIASMSKHDHILAVSAVELVKGLDENRHLDDAWHVQMSIQKDKESPKLIDIFLDPRSATSFIPQAQ